MGEAVKGTSCIFSLDCSNNKVAEVEERSEKHHAVDKKGQSCAKMLLKRVKKVLNI